MQRKQEASNPHIKIRVMGQASSGKTKLIEQYAGNELRSSFSPTSALVHREGATLQIDETETHRSSNSNPILFTVDLTDLASFRALESFLKNLYQHQHAIKPPIVVVGTHADKKSHRVVPAEDLTQLQLTLRTSPCLITEIH